jgi:hypothetical protein
MARISTSLCVGIMHKGIHACCYIELHLYFSSSDAGANGIATAITANRSKLKMIIFSDVPLVDTNSFSELDDMIRLLGKSV